MEKHIEQFILTADAKSLATFAEGVLNVIPVSSLQVVDGNIWLINYFMSTTVSNILSSPNVALVCWRKMMGYQIKGTAQYITEGAQFEEAVAWIQSLLPDRVVKGLIVITPTEIIDVSPTKNTREKFLAEQSTT